MESRNPEREARQAAAMREALRKMDEEDAKKAKQSKPVEPTKPKAQAGWYAHPSMVDTQRYWDGEHWTDNIAPVAASQPLWAPAQAKSQGARVLGLPIWVWVLGVGFLVAVGAVKVPGFLGGAYEADITMIESEIESGIRRQTDLTATVECPSSIDWEVGRTFNCIATASDGSRAAVEVTMENDDGDITWRVN